MFQKLNNINGNFRKPTEYEKQQINAYVEKNNNSYKRIYKISAVALIVLGCVLLTNVFIYPQYGMLIAIPCLALIVGGMLMSCSERKRNRELRAYLDKGYEVVDSECIQAEFCNSVDAASDWGRVKIKFEDGTECNDSIAIDAYTVVNKKAVGHKMLLVKFSENKYILFTEAMLKGLQ